MYEPRTILVPTDFSDCSDKALSIAIDVATKYGARLFLLHVIDKIVQQTIVDYSVPDGVVQQIYEDIVTNAQKRMSDGVAEISASRNITVEYAIKTGAPHEVILSEAKRQKADLIVMGPHGKTGLTKFLVGSVTEKVLKEAHTPVLVIR